MATPTRAKARLGKHMSEVRTRGRVPRAMAAEELKIAESSLSRYESGQVLPAWGTVVTLLNLYDASPDDRKNASNLWDRANDEPQSIRLPGGTPKAFRRLVNAEREATLSRHLEMSLVTGLLQTEAYMRALMDAGTSLRRPDSKVDDIVNNRLARQQRLLGSEPLAVHVLMDEAALHREIGGRDVLREQLAYLLAAAAKPHITIQIIPFSAGAYGLMNGNCAIVDYAAPNETPGVYLVFPVGGAWVDNEDDVRCFTTMFDEVAALALTPAESTDRIYQRIKALENT